MAVAKRGAVKDVEVEKIEEYVKENGGDEPNSP